MQWSRLKGFGLPLQGDFVLPTARTVYLIGACGCLIAVAIGLLVALFFHVLTWQSPSEAPVPAVTAPAHVALNLDNVNARLMPPTNIGLETGPVTVPVTQNSVIGRFRADTPNGLAAAPNDVLILGGEDAGSFERTTVRVESSLRTALRPTAALAETINKSQQESSAQAPRSFKLRVAARDTYGNLSAPTDIAFSLSFSAVPVTSAAPPSQGESAQLTDFQAVARDIALIVDPARSPVYFEAYRRAGRVPRECGARDNDPTFAADARQAFEKTKMQLRANNVEAFYAGLCGAWKAARNEEQAMEANMAAERGKVMAANMAERTKIMMATGAAKISRNVVLVFVGGALTTFLALSILLAFLAMENHSKAVREAVEAFAGSRHVTQASQSSGG